MKKKKVTARKTSKIVQTTSKSRLYQYLFIVIFAIIGSVLLLRSFAATGQLYLLPSASSVENGQQLTMQVRLNPQADVFGVQDVIVTYDTTKLDYISSNSTGSPFDDLNNPPGPIIGAGTLEYNQASLSQTVNQDFLIATITFQAKVGSGTTTLSVTGNAGANSGPTNPTGSSVTIGLTGTVTPPPPPPPPTGDSVSPVVSISSPSEGSSVTNQATISATASDNVGVTRMEVYVDGTLIKTVALKSTVTAKWNARKASSGTHTVTVKAYDAAGNVGQSAVTFNKL